jgi:hypothetical protein
MDHLAWAPRTHTYGPLESILYKAMLVPNTSKRPEWLKLIKLGRSVHRSRYAALPLRRQLHASAPVLPRNMATESQNTE